ncbi:hypothetical protein SHL15_6752 [Streptomyces hygroscopicus subsp. limoneus]|nr:hypothetical protein SHL15_6752 [Streptomyces hygroscopicus subsp. limoneus]
MCTCRALRQRRLHVIEHFDEYAVGVGKLQQSKVRKYAPGPCMLTLEVTGGVVDVTVWDSEPTLPIARAADRAG